MAQAAENEKRTVASLSARRAPYLTIRVTGVLLAVLALGHYAITHVVNDVAATDSSFINRRWGSALWVAWDGLLLATALLHAGAGLLTVVRDYRRTAESRRRWLIGLGVLILIVLVIGMAALVYSVSVANR